MSVSVISNTGALNKASDSTQNKILKQEISESEGIKAIALLCLGGFLIFWASMEGLGRISSEGFESSHKAYNKFCYKEPNLFVCPLFAFNAAVDCTMKAVYEKVGSFWLTVGLYLVPAIFTIRRVLKETSAEEIKNSAIPSNNLDAQNGSVPKFPANTPRKPLERIEPFKIFPNDPFKT